MSISQFFKSADSFATTLTVLYLSAYVGHFWLKRRVGDIQKIQQKVLYGMAKNHGNIELIDFISRVIAEDMKILMPTKDNNRTLHITSMLFIVIAVSTIFYDPMSQIFSSFITNDIVYSIFLILLSLSALFLFWEYRYWVDFGRLKTEYPNDTPESIRIVVKR